jgi:hypothetical protein
MADGLCGCSNGVVLLPTVPSRCGSRMGTVSGPNTLIRIRVHLVTLWSESVIRDRRSYTEPERAVHRGHLAIGGRGCRPGGRHPDQQRAGRWRRPPSGSAAPPRISPRCRVTTLRARPRAPEERRETVGESVGSVHGSGLDESVALRSITLYPARPPAPAARPARRARRRMGASGVCDGNPFRGIKGRFIGVHALHLRI